MHTFNRSPRPLVPALLCSCLLAVGGSCDRPHPSPRVWRFAIEESTGSVQDQYAQQFKRLIEEKSEGAIRVEVYPVGSLGTSTHITEQLNMGILEFAMASPGSLGKFIPELQVFLLHFLFSERDEVTRAVLNNPALNRLLDDLYQEKGLKLLSLYSEGEMVWTTNKEIREPADFRATKFRVMTSPILLAAYNAYGASATPMPYTEVYSALQLSMIDGQVNPVFAIERQKFYAVTSWMTFPKHAHFITTAAANRRFYTELSDRERAMVDDTIAELEPFIFNVQRQLQLDGLKEILKGQQRLNRDLTICGELSGFLACLSPSERAQLVDQNARLQFTRPLNEDEREKFRKRSGEVEEVFLRVGGDRAEEVLARIKSLVEQAENAAQG